MTLDTTQRVLFAVPTPKTEITLGQFFETRNDGNNATTSQYSGICAYTAEDLRFNATGAATQSDLIAQSKGQLWLQAIGNVVGIAGESMLVCSPAATLVAGQGGVTMLAGFTPSGLATQTDSGSMPVAVTNYDTTAKIPTIIWGIFDTVMAIGLTALDIYLTIADRPTGKSGFDVWGVQGSAANLAGAAINIAGLSGSPHVTLPGINMFAQAGILIGSALGAVNVIGVPGVLIQSTFTTQFALIASGVRGIKSASMTSLVTADVSALSDVTLRATDDVTLASRTDDTSVRGVKMKLGMINPKTHLVPGTPQLPTMSLKVQAMNEVTLESKLKVDVTANPAIDSTSVKDLTIDGGAKVAFKVGVFEITLDSTGLSAGSSAGGAKISFTDPPGSATMEGPGGVSKVTTENQKVTLEAGGGKQEFDLTSTTLDVSGVTFDIL